MQRCSESGRSIVSLSFVFWELLSMRDFIRLYYITDTRWVHGESSFICSQMIRSAFCWDFPDDKARIFIYFWIGKAFWDEIRFYF
jgi:hypothetical protein